MHGSVTAARTKTRYVLQFLPNSPAGSLYKVMVFVWMATPFWAKVTVTLYAPSCAVTFVKSTPVISWARSVEATAVAGSRTALVERFTWTV